jgi:hypothetical protein
VEVRGLCTWENGSSNQGLNASLAHWVHGRGSDGHALCCGMGGYQGRPHTHAQVCYEGKPGHQFNEPIQSVQSFQPLAGLILHNASAPPTVKTCATQVCYEGKHAGLAFGLGVPGLVLFAVGVPVLGGSCAHFFSIGIYWIRCTGTCLDRARSTALAPNPHIKPPGNPSCAMSGSYVACKPFTCRSERARSTSCVSLPARSGLHPRGKQEEAH